MSALRAGYSLKVSSDHAKRPASPLELGAERRVSFLAYFAKAGANSVANDCVHCAHIRRMLWEGQGVAEQSRKQVSPCAGNCVVTLLRTHKQARQATRRSNLDLNLTPLAIVGKIAGFVTDRILMP
jgi:hypothetical protein